MQPGYDGHVGLLIPLVLPCLTAFDLLTSPRSGHLPFRIAAAALTLLTPLFVLLELRRLESLQQPPPAGYKSGYAHTHEGEEEGGYGGLLGGLSWIGSHIGGQLASWLRQPWPSWVGLFLGLCDPEPSTCAAA